MAPVERRFAAWRLDILEIDRNQPRLILPHWEGVEPLKAHIAILEGTLLLVEILRNFQYFSWH
jgi:hypothetical protein